MAHTLSQAAAFLLVAAVAATTAVGGEALTAAGPGYRGSGTGGIYPAKGLLKSWPTEGPKLLWKVPLGNSAAPVTVFDDRVYCVAGSDAWLHTFTLEGKPAGKAHLGSASWKRFGFSRSAPLIAEGIAVGTTPNANLYGVDLDKMSLRWQVNAWKDFGSGKGEQGWGLPESPILHGANVVFNPVSRDDGTPPLVAVDIRDANQIVWEADPGIGKAYSASDCSTALFRHKGRNLIVSPTWCYLLCVDADTGKALWEIPGVGPKTLTPVYNDGLLLVTIQREIGPDDERQWPAWASLPLDPSYRPSTAPTQPAPVRLRDRMKDVRWSSEQMVLLRLSDDGADAAVQWIRHDAPGRYSHAVFLGGRIYCYGNPSAVVERSVDGTLPPLEERPSRSGRSALLCLDAATGKVLAQVSAETPGHVVSADGMLYAVDLVKVANNLDPSARPKLSPRVRLLYPTPKGMAVTGEKVLYAYDDVPELRDVEWEASVPPVIAHGRLFMKFGPLSVFNIRGQDYEELPAPPAAKGPPPDAPVRFPTTSLAVVRAADVPALLAQLGHRLAAHRKTAAALLARVEPSAAADTAVKLAEVATTGGAEAWPAQRAAAQALRAMGASARPALTALQKALPAAVARRDGTAARLMLDTIRGIDEGAAAVGRPLGELLSHKDRYVQYAAAGMLNRLGPGGAGGAGALVAAMQSDDVRVWRESAAALHAMGPAAGEAVAGLQAALLKALENKQTMRCGRILSALAQIDPQGAKPAVPRIAAMLADKDVELRRLAARMLQQAGTAGTEAIPALVAALGSDDPETAELASVALNAMKTQGGAAAALAKALEGGSGKARAKVMETLAGMGPAAEPAVPALSKLLGDPNLPAARAAAKVLAGVGPGAKGAVEPLTAALKRGDPELAGAAAAALGAVGAPAAPSADALLALLSHRDTALRGLAVRTLAKIGRSPAPALLDILKRERGPLQHWAAGAIATLDQPSDEVVAALAATLDANDARLVLAGQNALRALGPKAAKAVPALLKHIRGADARAAAAIGVIAQIGPEAKPAVGGLLEIARGKDAALAASAVRAMAGIGPGAESAVKPLVALSGGAGKELADAIQYALGCIKTANAAPTAKDVAVTCAEGGAVLIQFPASDPDDIAASLRVSSDERPAHGTLERASEWAPLPAMVYRSRSGFAGTETFTWCAVDRGREQSRPAKAVVTVLPDTTAPKLREAFVPLGAANAVMLTFDEPLMPESAGDASAYAIDGGVKVLKAQLDGESRRVVVLTTTLLAAGKYKLSAKGIRDVAKAANVGGGEVTFAHRPLKPGLKYVYCEQAAKVSPKTRVLADLDTLELKPKTSGVTPTVAMPVEKPAGEFTLRLDGAIDVPRVSESADYGRFTFTLTAAGSAWLFLDGRLVEQAIAGRRGEPGEMTLAAGMHAITIVYSHSRMDAPALSLNWSHGSDQPQEVPAAALHHPAEP
jgi:HEAT repeat protein/outer membrane protein assembly factor BamB